MPSLTDTLTVIPDANEAVWASWKDRLPADISFFAFIDGDPVESGNDFRLVMTNASGLLSQRGKGAQLAIFDRESGSKINL